MSTTLTPGTSVTFTTPGRYPRARVGVIETIDSAYATVKCDDGKTRQARPKTLTAV